MKYIDYGTMQSDAQRRVLEMQRRAHSAVYYQTPSHESSRNIPQKTPLSTHEPAADSCCAETAVIKPQTSEAKCETDHDNNELLQLLTRDPEQLLLLTILVLLLAEKADMILILALVYLIL